MKKAAHKQPSRPVLVASNDSQPASGNLLDMSDDDLKARRDNLRARAEESTADYLKKIEGNTSRYIDTITRKRPKYSVADAERDAKKIDFILNGRLAIEQVFQIKCPVENLLYDVERLHFLHDWMGDAIENDEHSKLWFLWDLLKMQADQIKEKQQMAMEVVYPKDETKRVRRAV